MTISGISEEGWAMEQSTEGVLSYRDKGAPPRRLCRRERGRVENVVCVFLSSGQPLLQK